MKSYLRFLRFIKPYRAALAANIIGSVIFAVLSTFAYFLVNPLYTVISELGKQSQGIAPSVSPVGNLNVPSWLDGLKGRVMDSLMQGGTPGEALARLAALIITVFAVKNIVKYASDVLMAYVSNGVIKDVRNALFEKLTSLSLGFFHGRKSGEIISRITNDVTVLNDALAPLASILVHEPLQIAFMLAMLLTLSVRLTIIAAATSIVSLALIRLLGKFIRRYSARIQDRIADVTAALQEALANMRIVKAYSAERQETDKFIKHTSAHFKAGMKFWRTSHLFAPINEIFAVAALVVVLFSGGRLVHAGAMQPADMITFITMLFGLMSPVVTLSGFYSQVQRSVAAAKVIAEIFDEQPLVKDGSRVAPPFKEAIVFHDVNFSFNNSPTLSDISLRIRRGETVALVGPSGGGKSTLADLMLRLYDPTTGAIFLDGVNIREFETRSYRKMFGVVTQESMLFNDTIRNNITYGMADATEKQVKEAARIAYADDFIENLPNGYNTVIGDRGARLSGGERQRIAIARAVLRNPEILIFDEATSALDSQSEHLVQRAIEHLLADRTAVIIAHRLSTIQIADTIVVIEHGRIVQSGSHAELAKETGLYQKLYDIQMGYETPNQIAAPATVPLL